MNLGTIIDEQALKASTFSESSNYKGYYRGKDREKRGRSNEDSGRQNFKTNNHNDQSNSQGKERVCNQQYEKSKIKFYRCYKIGHYHSEYYNKLPKGKEMQ